MYYAQERLVVDRDGMLIMADDDRMELLSGESIQHKLVRFRTLGCYPLTGAIESSAASIARHYSRNVINQNIRAPGRLIDQDSGASMEIKKQEGYF